MERMRRRGEFLAAASGLRVHTGPFVLQARRREDEGPARVGFTVSKKVGNAVERNRVRRRLREIVRLSPLPLPDGHDYVLVGRRAALTQSFAEMTLEFEGALKRVQKRRAAPITGSQ